MNLDVQSLRTFSRLAGSGAETAADSLSQLTGIDTYVDVTEIELNSRQDVACEFRERDLVSVEIGFSGGIDGRTVLAFDRDSAGRIVEALLPGDPAGDDLATSGLEEVGNIMIGGFIDGWADYLGTSVDISTPTYLDVDGANPIDDVEAHDGRVLVFRNQLETAADAISFYLYMVPTPESVGTIVEASGNPDDALPLETYTAFSRMIDEGAEQASADMSAMTGIETDVEVSRLSFVPIEGVPSRIADETRTGVVLDFEGTPSGYIAILFDDESAEHIAGALLPGMDDAPPEMRESAIEEIGNIVTSGFVDGWANALDTTIDISPPRFVRDFGPAIMDPLATDLARRQEHAFLIDSTIRTADDEFTCDIFALPDERELQRALDHLAPA